MDVTTIPQTPGSRKGRKRVGRGIGSGHGKTATRGTKGQGARTGSRKRPGFEGSQTPLLRRLPKRGFKRKETGQVKPFAVINLKRLNVCKEGETVNAERLWKLGLIRSSRVSVKLLADGELKKKLTLQVHAASESAKQKVAKAGGSVELMKPNA